MFGFNAVRTLAQPVTHDNRRRAGRVYCVMLGCRFGPVLDISCTGMRVRAGRMPRIAKGETQFITLEVPGGSLDFPARVVRLRTIRGTWGIFGGYTEIGFEFTDLSSQQRQKLFELARTAVDDELLGGRRAG